VRREEFGAVAQNAYTSMKGEIEEELKRYYGFHLSITS
jgi:hypothetical protein